jgi:hypothetical protein
MQSRSLSPPVDELARPDGLTESKRTGLQSHLHPLRVSLPVP